MKQAALTKPGTFELQEAPQPEPGPGQALVRVRNVGVCGSDLHFFHGDFPVPPGFVLGHECAGEVVSLGEGVTGFEAGDRVALELFDVCLRCVQCRGGNYHLCPSRKAQWRWTISRAWACQGAAGSSRLLTPAPARPQLRQAETVRPKPLLPAAGWLCLLWVSRRPASHAQKHGHPILGRAKEQVQRVIFS